MDPLAVAQRYFDAWNARDPEAIAAAFAPGGTYSDPNVPDGLDPAGDRAICRRACSRRSLTSAST